MTLAGDIKGGVSAAFCGLFSGYDKVARYADGLLSVDGKGNRYRPSLPGKVANGGIALFCDRPPFPEPGGQPATGQCPVRYNVTLTFDQVGLEGEYLATQTYSRDFVLGPIGGIVKQGAYATKKLGVSSAEGFVVVVENTAAEVDYANARDLIVVRRDGLADNCGGDVPPVYPPLLPGDTTVDIDVNNSTGPVFFFPPILNINGDLSVPFNFDVGGVELNGELQLNTGDINLNFGGQPTDPPIPKLPTPDDNPPPGDMDDPEPEKLANIIGVIVISTRTTDLSVTEVPQSVMPDIYIPRLADVSFQIRIGNKTHWTSDIPVKSRNAWIPLLGEISAIDVGVQSRRGWTHSATPVRAIAPPVTVA